MNFEEFKLFVIKKYYEKSKQYPYLSEKKFTDRFRQELNSAKIYYEKIGDLYEKLTTVPVVNNNYVIPFIIDLTESVAIDKPIQSIQITTGDSGGIDIDSDFGKEHRDVIVAYLKHKYGEDCVIPVGTLSTFKLKVTCKDLLRYCNVPTSESMAFTNALDDELSWEENLENIKATFPVQYRTYEKNKNVLDRMKMFLDKPRNTSTHAGGILITPKPVWNYCPVDKTKTGLVTAFEESGARQSLDSLGLVKLDLLSISALETIAEALDLIEEDLFLIEENGVEKIVPKSYLKKIGVEV